MDGVLESLSCNLRYLRITRQAKKSCWIQTHIYINKLVSQIPNKNKNKQKNQSLEIFQRCVSLEIYEMNWRG